jgi:hypothetical protein
MIGDLLDRHFCPCGELLKHLKRFLRNLKENLQALRIPKEEKIEIKPVLPSRTCPPSRNWDKHDAESFGVNVSSEVGHALACPPAERSSPRAAPRHDGAGKLKHTLPIGAGTSDVVYRSGGSPRSGYFRGSGPRRRTTHTCSGKRCALVLYDPKRISEHDS